MNLLFKTKITKVDEQVRNIAAAGARSIGRAAALPRSRLPPGAAASSSPAARAASPERCTGGPAEGAEQRRCVGGVRAGPRDRPGAARTGEGWWGRGGPGFLQRFTGATAGSRHSRPRDSQGAHVGALGGKMRTILRRIQRAYFRRNRSAGSRATSVAVRHRRRVHAHMHFSVVFHTKTLPNGADLAAEGSLASKPMRGDKMRVFSRVCARLPGRFPSTFLAILGRAKIYSCRRPWLQERDFGTVRGWDVQKRFSRVMGQD